MLIGGDDISNDVIILGADWRKSDSWVEGEPRGNWRWNSNSRDIVASSPSFSRPALRAPRRVGSQAKIRQTDLHKYSCTIHPGSKVSFCLFLNWGEKMEAPAESRPIVSSLQGCRSPNFWTSPCREIQCCTCIKFQYSKRNFWSPRGVISSISYTLCKWRGLRTIKLSVFKGSQEAQQVLLQTLKRHFWNFFN